MKLLALLNFILLFYFTYERVFGIPLIRMIDYITGFSVLFSLVIYSVFIIRKNIPLFYSGSVFLVLSFSYYLLDAWLFPLGGWLYSFMSSMFLSFMFIFPIYFMFKECKKHGLLKSGSKR